MGKWPCKRRHCWDFCLQSSLKFAYYLSVIIIIIVSIRSQNFKVAGYTTVDAALKYDLGRFGLPGSTVGVNVNNLFNREYVASCYREYACYWGAERQIVGTATFRF